MQMRTIHLPEELCESAEKKFGHRFGSAEELLAALLKQILREDALQMDKEEEQIVESRLKALGYV